MDFVESFSVSRGKMFRVYLKLGPYSFAHVRAIETVFSCLIKLCSWVM